jgi:uncharacterized protein YbjT (DUF2867 family)
MTILVIGATGGVGRDVAAGLVDNGLKVRAMTHYAAKQDKLPAGVEGCVADLSAAGSLTKAFSGVEKVFMMTPLSQNEIQMGLNAVLAATMAGVKKIVYMSVPHGEGSDQIPHYRNKVLVEKKLRESGVSYTILRPNNFFQNDLWGQAAIMAYGTYPQPLGNVGLNRVDSRDVADAAVNALMSDSFAGQEIALHGADVLTGDSIAAIFSAKLGREIRYAGDDLEAWAKQSQHMMPAWMVNDFKIMYQYFQTHGQLASEEELTAQQAVVGHAPRSFDAFVSELVQAWSEG